MDPHQEQYAKLKALATSASTKKEMRGPLASEIARYTVSELRRFGFSDGHLCTWGRLPGFERYAADLNALQKQGRVVNLGVEIEALSRRGRLRCEASRTLEMKVSSVEVRRALKDEILRSTAKFRAELVDAEKKNDIEYVAKDRGLVLFAKIPLNLPSNQLKEVERKIREEFRNFTVLLERTGEISSQWSSDHEVFQTSPTGERTVYREKGFDYLRRNFVNALEGAIGKARLPLFYDAGRYAPAQVQRPMRVTRDPNAPSAQNDKAADFGPDFV